MVSEWADMARRLAAVERRAVELERERGQLAAERQKLMTRLAEMLDASERQARVPAWAGERRRQTVEPGHGAETSRLMPGQRPLSQLSTATPCPSGCAEAALHTHFADGVTQVWAPSNRHLLTSE